MKPGGSSLNPYAEAYVPLAKREAPVVDEEQWHAKPPPTQHQPHVAHGLGIQGTGSGSGLQGNAYKQMNDDDLDMDMDIEFLLVTFSGLSYESINGVYLANNGDLDATIEMLTQLEIYSTEAEEYLPDTLDIGDVPETTRPSSSIAPELKNANSKASASSSSGTPNVHVP
ncbi:unnamed protein product [Cochlearia groenlandica]